MTRKDPEDLDRFLPDKAEIEAVLNRPVRQQRDIDPKLRARQQEINRHSSSPEILPPAPPSVRVYAEAELPEADAERATLPRAGRKVEIALPPKASEMPTQPSLKRIELDVPGVVNGVPQRGRLRISRRAVVLAVLLGLIPLAVLAVTGRGGPKGRENPGAASAVAATVVPSAAVPAAPSAAPTATASPAPVASEVPSAPPVTPTATASAAVPAPKGATVKQKPQPPHGDPYDTAPATPKAAPTSSPAPEVATVAPAVAPAPVPTVAPAAPPTVLTATPTPAKPGPAGGDHVIFGN